jgi:glucose/arabinose dehydrogenase
LVTGLDAPWGLTFLPDGSALVSQRISGEIVRIPAAGGAPQPVGVVPDVQASSEGGLLGIVVSPEFATDRTVFASVSGADENRIVALTIAEDFRSLALERVLLDGIQTADRHHGGRVVIGPDGHLWIGTGDAFEPENAATEDSLNGKILRIATDGSVPEGNPGSSPIFSSGHRNIQGIAFGPDGTPYASELGHRTWDEVNVLRPGADYDDRILRVEVHERSD